MRICLAYQVVCCHKNEDSEEYEDSSNVLRGLAYSDLTYTKVSEVASQYILSSGSLWYPLKSSMLKNKRIFSLVLSKLTPTFLSVQLDVAENYITNRSQRINSRSLRGVIKLTSALNFGIFAHSKTLISQFTHFISKTGG